ncbi:MAG: hypothetical protein JXR73_07880 [Candidatus Omnitrophica bacterium]|nr:hypothetical protein [Candidatus Omnitrophota bacterium]
MFHLFRKHYRLTPEQKEAEREAVRLLTKAQKLLEKDYRNVEEAKRLRCEATDQVLPKHRMYIPAKHPRSLLIDVDQKIELAYIRQIQLTGEISGERASPYEEAQRAYAKWKRRYGRQKEAMRRRMFWSLIWFAAVSLVLLILAWILMKNGGAKAFRHSFDWLFEGGVSPLD